jgi:hypothetical protein
MAHIIGSTPGPPNILPDGISDPVMVISLKLMKGKFCQGCHGHGRAMNNSKFYSIADVENKKGLHEPRTKMIK